MHNVTFNPNYRKHETKTSDKCYEVSFGISIVDQVDWLTSDPKKHQFKISG